MSELYDAALVTTTEWTIWTTVHFRKSNNMRQPVACLLEESEELTNDITSRTTKVINLNLG